MTPKIVIVSGLIIGVIYDEIYDRLSILDYMVSDHLDYNFLISSHRIIPYVRARYHKVLEAFYL